MLKDCEGCADRKERIGSWFAALREWLKLFRPISNCPGCDDDATDAPDDA